MAEIQYTQQRLEFANDRAHLITWANMANGEVGVPFKMPRSADRSVQVDGTFGSGGNLRIEGSNNETYYPLTDPQGNALNITSGKIEAVTEIVVSLRPSVTAGDGTTSLTVTMLVRRTN